MKQSPEVYQEFYEQEAEWKRFLPEVDATERIRVEAALRVFPRARLQSALDVGCGDGYLCGLYKHDMGIERVAGVDLSLRRMIYASKEQSRVDFLQGSAYELPFDDESFSLVSAVELLEHLEDPLWALGELTRVSKEHVLVTVPNNEPLKEIICPRCQNRFYLYGHLQSFDRERMERLFKECGLTRIVSYIYKPTIESDRIFRTLRPLLLRTFPGTFQRGGLLALCGRKR